jgi:uncharacterized protein
MINYELLRNRVKQKLENEPSGHDFSHALRVANNASLIAQGLDINLDLVQVCCLVHDLIDEKLEEQYKCTENQLLYLLVNCDCSKSFISDVFYIINRISYRKNQLLDSIEGRLVQDADRLDALGAIGIARTFSFGGANNRKMLDDGDNALTSVGHFYDKLFKLETLMNTENAKKEAHRRTQFMVKYIEELKAETGILNFRK